MCQKYMKAKFLTVEKRKTGKRISLSDGFCFSCHSERRSGGPKSRNLLLSTDLSTAARGDMEDGKGGRSFGCAQDDIKKRMCNTLRIRFYQKNETYCDFIDNPAWQPRAGHKDRLYLHLSLHNHCMRTSKSPSSPEKCSDIYA